MHFIKLGIKRYHATTFFEGNEELSYAYFIGLCYDCLNDLADTHRGLTGLALAQTVDFKSEVIYTAIQFGGKDGHALKGRAGQLNDATGWKPDAVFLQLGRSKQAQRKLDFIIYREEGFVSEETMLRLRDQRAGDADRFNEMQRRIQRKKDLEAFRAEDVVILGTTVDTIVRIIRGPAGVRASFKTSGDRLVKEMVEEGVYAQDPIEVVKMPRTSGVSTLNCLWREQQRCAKKYTIEFIDSISTPEQIRAREAIAAEAARIVAFEKALVKARSDEQARCYREYAKLVAQWAAEDEAALMEQCRNGGIVRIGEKYTNFNTGVRKTRVFFKTEAGLKHYDFDTDKMKPEAFALGKLVPRFAYDRVMEVSR